MLNTEAREAWRIKKEMLEIWPSQQRLLEDMKKEINRLNQEIHHQKNDIEKNDKNNEILGILFEKGIIDSEGNLL